MRRERRELIFSTDDPAPVVDRRRPGGDLGLFIKAWAIGFVIVLLLLG